MITGINPDGYVPKRAFGNSGARISKLCLGGGSFGGADTHALLEEALRLGVDCWEIVSFTGNVYGEYFTKNPGVRDKIFLSGKVYSTDPVVMQEQLNKVLKENETSYLDFLAIHHIDDIKAMHGDVRRWVAKVKKENKIRFFGFCTHKNMDRCLSAGAELGWIDGIQTVYNYRLKSVKSMEDALHKCHEKGIGIFAVKSMGFSVRQRTGQEEFPFDREKSASLLPRHHLSIEQAKLQAIWQNSDVTSICSLMPNLSILQSNVSAAKRGGPLHAEIEKLLAEYADVTGKYYCRRCGECDKANADNIPIFAIMEMLMYSRKYSGMDRVAKMFANIPLEMRNRIPSSDYSIAENKCPQKMPIGQLMNEAYQEFST